MLRDPYIAGVERFELMVAPCIQNATPQRKEQAALFCLLLWEQFQKELRALRYHISFENLDETTLEFSQQPRYDELISFDSSSASQIDIEVISQQPAPPPRHPRLRSPGEEEHFPAFLEVFIPLWPQIDHPEQAPDTQSSRSRLVVWCKPTLLPQVTTLWEQAPILHTRHR